MILILLVSLGIAIIAQNVPDNKTVKEYKEEQMRERKTSDR
jgi:hypothetical protein